jgi:hypothetical protein
VVEEKAEVQQPLQVVVCLIVIMEVWVQIVLDSVVEAELKLQVVLVVLPGLELLQVDNQEH